MESLLQGRCGTMIATGILTGLATACNAAPVGAFSESPSGRILSGYTIVIDPGHGGKDPGGIGSRAKEHVLNLQIAGRLADWYRKAGARVVMTWSSPRQMPPSRRFNVRQRVHFINRSRADLLIDIHCNAGGPYRGPQTFYWSGAASYLLAHDIQAELQYLTGTRRQVNRINQYVLRYAHMPAVNVEVGFITNPTEERQLMNPHYQSRLAWAILVGTARWALHARWPERISNAPDHVEMLKR